MSYQDTLTLANDPTFQARVQVAVLEAALNVMNEGRAHSGYDTYYDKRADLAKRMIHSSGAGLPAFTFAVASNTTISIEGTSAPDGDLAFAVAGLWDPMADITAAERPPV